MTKDTGTTEDLRVMLSEAKQSYAYQYDSFDVLKGQASTALGASSLIVSLVGLLQIFRQASLDLTAVQVVLIVILALLYLWQFITSMAAIGPLEIATPIKPEWDVMSEYYRGATGDELLKLQLSSYLNAIQKNEPLKVMLTNRVKQANRLLAASVFLLLATAVVMLIA